MSEVTISRDEIKEDIYVEIFEKESHHAHELVIDKDGTIRWKADKYTNHYLQNISLNDLCPLLQNLGFGKNSEVYRKLYRNMGTSLFAYWEVFYWEMNNEDADEYVANAF